MEHTLPPLPYDYNALEPHLDAATLHVHHDKHHQAYVDKLNDALAPHPKLAAQPLEMLLSQLDSLPVPPEDIKKIRNNGGGHVNHSLYWQIMGPQKEIDRDLVAEIERIWSSIDNFKKEFTAQATSIFGSGWMWLARRPGGALTIYPTANQDSPLMRGDTPIIGLDVWEHAYYLKYQNRRPEYISAWWSALKLLP